MYDEETQFPPFLHNRFLPINQDARATDSII